MMSNNVLIATLSDHDSIKTVFIQTIANFTADEFEQLCSAVCPVIEIHARCTGAVRGQDGRPPNSALTNGIRDMVMGVTFDGGGSALTAGTTVARYVTLPAACTIVAFDISVDAGTATFKTWRVASGTAIPTVSDSISTSGVAISTGTALHSTTVTDWTDTTLDANDIIGLNLSTVATATLASFQITCRR